MRLGPIEGLPNRRNDVVYSPPLKFSLSHELIIFFPGDIQNYPEEMMKYASLDNIQKWNLEYVSEQLSSKFPLKHILVVKPSRTHDGVYNHYDNFVEANKNGNIDLTKGRSGLPHLRRLVSGALQEVQVRLKTLQALPTSTKSEKITTQGSTEDGSVCPKDVDLSNKWTNFSFIQENISIDSISIVGFSKGCVVLNELVTEIYMMTDFEEDEKDACNNFLEKIGEMAWLDGGHQGKQDTWITDRSYIQGLVTALPSLKVTVHVTPYQMSCKRRPWIGQECQQFVSLCRAVGLNLSYSRHGEDHETPSIDTHFLALEAYGS